MSKGFGGKNITYFFEAWENLRSLSIRDSQLKEVLSNACCGCSMILDSNTLRVICRFRAQLMSLPHKMFTLLLFIFIFLDISYELFLTNINNLQDMCQNTIEILNIIFIVCYRLRTARCKSRFNESY